jgi:crossover junction endodeoxyribonuclease RuvC
MNRCGVDAGVGGALSLFGPDDRLMAVADMPTTSVRVGKTQRHRINGALLAQLLRDWEVGHAAVEAVRPRPTDTPVTAAYLVGAHDRVLGVLEALGIPYTPVESRAWRATAGIKLGPTMVYRDRKEASRLRALQLFPLQAAYFARKKDSDRAEAALIGWWLVQKERLG